MVAIRRIVPQDARLAAVGDQDDIEVAIAIEVRARTAAADHRLEQIVPRASLV